MKYVKINFSYVMEKALVALFVYIGLSDHGMTTFISIYKASLLSGESSLT